MIEVSSFILCGGSGTSLWPLSRRGFPEQFPCLTGRNSLLQRTATLLAHLGTAHIILARPLLVAGEDHRFKVKRIQVKPGPSLSLQKHHHRAEHWVVVTGTAEINNGGKVIPFTENQSSFIPLGEVRRLANPGSIPLENIEVQSGSYLGEDHIVRFEDHYWRKT